MADEPVKGRVPADACTIRDAASADAASIAEIYNVHVRGTIVTFEMEEVAVSEMCDRIAGVQARGLPWLVLERRRSVLGYAYAVQWKPRAGYGRTVETSVYLHDDAFGLGYGKRLYTTLLERLRAAGIRTVIGGAALPNPASARLHEGLGFRPVGVFREVGHKLGQWVDVGYWQLLLAAATR